MEWVDTDGCISAPKYCPYFITSVEKGIQASVKAAIYHAQGGTFKGGNYIGTLKNGGVTLAPFHSFASKVPASLQKELATSKGGNRERLDRNADQEPCVSRNKPWSSARPGVVR